MKYFNNSQWNEIGIKVTDTLPEGTIIDYDGTEVPDGYEEVTDEEVVLFSGSSYTSVTLSDDVSNYKYLDVYCVSSDNRALYTKVIKSMYGATFTVADFALDGNLYVKLAHIKISGTALTFVDNKSWYKYYGSSSGGYNGSDSVIAIYKVIGHK